MEYYETKQYKREIKKLHAIINSGVKNTAKAKTYKHKIEMLLRLGAGVPYLKGLAKAITKRDENCPYSVSNFVSGYAYCNTDDLELKELAITANAEDLRNIANGVYTIND